MPDNEQVSILRRFGAIFYDALLIGATVFIVGGIIATLVSRMMGLEEIEPGSTASRLLFILWIFLAFLLFGWFWTHGGQTLGMRAWKIKVITFAGEPLTWQQAFFRYMAALFSWVAFGVGYLIALFDPEQLTWHDRFSKTRLVRVPKN